MARAGEKVVIRVDIACPFCLENTKKWKMIPAVWKWSKVDGPVFNGMVRPPQLGLEAIDEKRALEFERSVLQKHLPDCNARTHLSPKVLELYKLTI